MTTDQDTEAIKARAVPLFFGIVLLYLAACAYQFSDYPLSLSPQLDAAENLNLAAQFDAGAESAEPFYRAPLYPFVLSLLQPVEWRPLLGLLLGLGCHLVNGFLVYGLSRRIWDSRPSAVLAAALYLLNPASIYFSLQLLDITPGLTLFLGGLHFAWTRPFRWQSMIPAGLLLGLAVVTRPHFLPVVLLVPVLLFLFASGRKFVPLLAFLPLGLVLLVMGLVNQQRSGEFRILPWQGAYNLWAANKPRANGLYYKQEVDLSALGDLGNPAKEESILLYGKAHPGEARPYSIERMNAYWRGRFLEHALEDPLALAGLWLFKGYAVVNAFDQYNNTTFSFHRDRLPLLRFNPLNWGILLLLAVPGASLMALRDRKALGVLILLILGYSVALVLYYASARFRLPLVPLLAILAGGVIPFIRDLRSAWPRPRPSHSTAIVLAVLAGFVSFSSLAGIRSTDTYIQDRLLLANAGAAVQRDLEAALLAREVLAEQPERNEAQQIYAVSYFNMRLFGDPAFSRLGNWADQKSWVKPESISDPDLRPLVAFYQWHWGQREQAVTAWRETVDSSPLAKAALQAISRTGEALPAEAEAVRRLLNSN
ncbi:MAG: hypothetical protein ACP5I4_08810 [Oceanipulchritudo sp.]